MKFQRIPSTLVKDLLNFRLVGCFCLETERRDTDDSSEKTNLQSLLTQISEIY